MMMMLPLAPPASGIAFVFVYTSYSSFFLRKACPTSPLSPSLSLSLSLSCSRFPRKAKHRKMSRKINGLSTLHRCNWSSLREEEKEWKREEKEEGKEEDGNLALVPHTVLSSSSSLLPPLFFYKEAKDSSLRRSGRVGRT